MNRTDIVEYTRNNGGGENLPRKTVREALDFVIEEITNAVLTGESVKLTGFGTFEVRKREDRLGRNPKTGEPLLIKSHSVVVFRPTRHFWGEEETETPASADTSKKG
ncbi:MAG: HU family DNA-binding protein [Leptospirillia bacterium]